ncbi:hypothetical protein [Actinoplanes sp. NPDC049599]|uniref:hypothetical protein n=1 Tax=Actinoplanes sp. NPDC049599 TaxID=3363903 RepID=UPI0037ACC976
MESTSADRWDNASRQWAPPRQKRRPANAAKSLPDGFGGRSNVASAPGTRRRETPAGTARTSARPVVETGKPALRAIIQAVEEMREDRPRICVGGLYLQFRCRGGRWALVTREDVRVALAGIECAARREFLAPGGAESPRRPAARTPHGSWPLFQQAVAELGGRGADPAGMLRLLHERGWQRVGHDDVARALRRIGTANTPRHFLPGQSLPAPRQAAPGLCPSCAVPITDLGLCRCS